MKKVLFSAILLGLLSACASTSDKDQSGVAVEDKSMGQKSGADTSGSQQSKVTANPLTDPNNILSKRSIYFDLDSFSVKDEYKSIIEAHAQYLKQNGKAKAFLQGNCDERGSREYNIALGNRRAESVRKMMNVFGASDSQIEVVSFGEEKPRATCHDESCLKENRRADIVYHGE